MSKVVIFGAGDIPRLAHDYFRRDSPHDVVAFTVVGGVGGRHEVNVHLAQIHVPSLEFTIYGQFAGVHLAEGGQTHAALLGRSFLQNFSMVYEGGTGTVTIAKNEPDPAAREGRDQ